MNWKCSLGIHDWEIVGQVIDIHQLRENVRCELDNLMNRPGQPPWPPMRIIYSGIAKRLKQRVCIRCKRYEDTITPEKNKIRAELFDNIMRQDLAKEILNDNA